MHNCDEIFNKYREILCFALTKLVYCASSIGVVMVLDDNTASNQKYTYNGTE